MRRIASEDSVRFEKANRDLYRYLKNKTTEIVNTQKIGPAGWAFKAVHPDSYIACAIWANGSSSAEQCAPYTGDQPGETWWPCVVLDPSHNRLEAGLQLVPFICPVLALNSARPWEANINRLTRVAFPQPGPPPVPA